MLLVLNPSGKQTMLYAKNYVGLGSVGLHHSHLVMATEARRFWDIQYSGQASMLHVNSVTNHLTPSIPAMRGLGSSRQSHIKMSGERLMESSQFRTAGTQSPGLNSNERRHPERLHAVNRAEPSLLQFIVG